MSDSLRPRGLQPTRLLGPWDFPGKSTEVGFHFLLQGIFPTQGSNPGLPHCRQTLLPSDLPGKPHMYVCYTYKNIFFIRLFSIIGDYNILSIVPCAIQQILVYNCLLKFISQINFQNKQILNNLASFFFNLQPKSFTWNVNSVAVKNLFFFFSDLSNSGSGVTQSLGSNFLLLVSARGSLSPCLCYLSGAQKSPSSFFKVENVIEIIVYLLQLYEIIQRDPFYILPRSSQW